ncbi:hypothetical protein SLEP1_g8176 [Rubroshorea leprosula]|uniref:Uncharacterized protein n=2 Tax=Rubroshorea leprosula TaxID=152421 RepID=A0AAV5I8S0_9ROSI|nr:hypothetical protein SLEP1_g8176 [Rubroshorea leprosula]
MIQVEKVQLNLEPVFPSFATSVVRSHIASCFWMGFPGMVRVNDLTEVDGALGLLNLDAHTKKNDAGKLIILSDFLGIMFVLS